ncbi:PadR family transcriptional regulator [Natrononativus amylolyticus]|uniref:PadR family transcriptional regulator n=1 Tax=Natrononativus amylolyticus TaxID=2963434 RepID=UPI0020CCF519|nr:helix-turn-helix transcriptional regulator [Natrononativus amylolyticus]
MSTDTHHNRKRTDSNQPALAHELTLFQIDLLVAVRDLEATTPPSGSDLKDALEDALGKEINHGRLYPNLDTLVEYDLVEKGTLDRRTNTYELTANGRGVLNHRTVWVSRGDQ